MDRLKNLVALFVKDDQGQDLIEYALLATFVSLVAIAGATLLGTALNNWYDAVSDRVDTAAGGAASAIRPRHPRLRSHSMARTSACPHRS